MINVVTFRDEILCRPHAVLFIYNVSLVIAKHLALFILSENYLSKYRISYTHAYAQYLELNNEFFSDNTKCIL